ncbi:MAG: 30S ribosomal protein S6 [candidate division WWE3 bacterium GW2011_GWC1_41_7]|uniref:Small ribosomal subunit protein bS6 n=4 Tax=Katanobacteria TaxID=422282 RepID=A0A0G1A7X2_UNCKA|nr:MAG: 30S ribosomal protein S6 [candidate division WWE3 bacterium GW2011_GWB1_41_6]KKS21423.1 MAG: 30S ribosomal protein S6 [candidate division WWE3 bacterium GW2011_GWC1_41_7]KKS22227.1 MAG: 30S ribosomal protein S6 [candidate division WWE3 bacterium GW2011_GWA1_41_8]OGC57014.1 MAG: 30S ribosomal protein S6 [candidate division WWE3 bacterium RIFCSPLOWO2_01_FULL_41_9]
MKVYEIMTITKNEIGEEGSRNLSNTVKDLISQYKGKVLDSNFWGKRKFAYKINHDTEGYYDVINFEMAAENMPKLESKLNFIDGLIRYLVTAD